MELSDRTYFILDLELIGRKTSSFKDDIGASVFSCLYCHTISITDPAILPTTLQKINAALGKGAVGFQTTYDPTGL